MSHELVPFDPSLIILLRKSFNREGLPLPFVKEIFLIECHVAGTHYVEGIGEREPELQIQDIIILQREPGNPHDELAILILDEKGRKLGYVPRKNNEVLARLMDAGKLIFGKLEMKSWEGDWLHLRIKIYLRDL